MKRKRTLTHEEKVQAIAAEVKQLAQKCLPAYIQKGGVSHFVPLPEDCRFRGKPISIASLNEILFIDPEEQIAIVEAGVPFAELVKKTLEYHLAPAVVPELEGITVGGAVAGCSIESMSHHYGGFHDTCLEYEIVTGTGEVLTCSRDQDPLLFEMLHGSYGTLGILTKLKLKLIPAKPYVELQYRNFDTVERFQAGLKESCEGGVFEFIDAIVHNPHSFVLCLGKFVDQAPWVSNYRKINIYYKSTLEKRKDYLNTYDYFFRYDTECHWLTKTVPLMENPLIRSLIGKWVLGSTNLIRWSKRMEWLLKKTKKRPDVVCDIFIPASRFLDFFKWYEKIFAFYPLWVIPYHVEKPYPWINPSHASQMNASLFIDCAIYGKPNQEPNVDYSLLLEEKTFELGGIKTLISRNHYNRERFWEIYNRENYENAKVLGDPSKFFPDLYEKFHSSF